MIPRFLPVLLALAPLSAFAADPAKTVTNEAPGEMLNHTTCTSGSDSRELEIVAKERGFAVKYLRKGETKEIGACSTNQEKCQAVFDNIKNNLIAAGYVCKT